jgi:hypothetical protein
MRRVVGLGVVAGADVSKSEGAADLLRTVSA